MPNTSRYADKKAATQLADALETLPANWLACRDMRHAWNILNDFHVIGPVGSKVQHIRRTLSCLRCETLREERYTLGRYGIEKIGQSYVYPDEYQIKGIPRGVKPSSFIQAEQLRRAMEREAVIAAAATD